MSLGTPTDEPGLDLEDAAQDSAEQQPFSPEAELHRQVIEQVAAEIGRDLTWRRKLFAAKPGQRFNIQRKVSADLGDGNTSHLVFFTLQKLGKGNARVLHGKPGVRIFATKYPRVEYVLRRPFPVYQNQKKAALESFWKFSQGDGLPEWPVEIFLELSNICDLKCAMCPTFSALNPRRFINLRNTDRGLLAVEDGTQPLEELLKHALVVHTFGYGEPTIHPQFREFIDYISQYEVMIDFFSHGMHLTEELCVFLVERSISCITISFSGADKEDYENVYIGGDFDRVMAGITRLAETKKRFDSPYPEIHVNSIGFRHHVDQLDRFAEMMGKAGVNRINLKPLSTYDNMPELHTHISVMREGIEGKVLERAKEIAARYGMVIDSQPFENIRVDDNADVMEFLNSRHKGGAKLSDVPVDVAELKVISKEKKAMREDDGVLGEQERERLDKAREHFMPIKNQVPCFEPFKTFYASFNGDVYPCCFKHSNAQPLGSLKQTDGTAIWQQGDFRVMREKAVENGYRSDICAICIRNKIYPKRHTVDIKVGRYARWMARTFQVNMEGRFVDRIANLPDNQTIFANHRRQREKLAKLQQAFVDAGVTAGVSMSASVPVLLANHSIETVVAAIEGFMPGSRASLRSALLSSSRHRQLMVAGVAGLGTALLFGIGNVLAVSPLLAALELALIGLGLPMLLAARLMKVVSLETVADILGWLEKRQGNG